ncbi:MAG: metallophosphoesterase [Bacteroidetes bacterium]|nr:metallophosphoesterase [Bacteroidota bacterium]
MYHEMGQKFCHEGTKTRRHTRSTWCLGALVAIIFLIPSQLSAQNESVASDRVRELPSASFYTVAAPIATTGYTFLAAGHWYGANENYQSIGPAASLLGAVDKIKAAQPNWVFALGDVVRNSDNAQQVAQYQHTLEAFGCPMILVPGNHDLLADGSLPPSIGAELPCQRAYGDQFIFLDTGKAASAPRP